MELEGGCHCGAVRYRVSGEPEHIALCHCTDCRKSAGAPMVGWAAFAEADVSHEQGEVTTFNSSGATLRMFCPRCGSGVFSSNQEMLPGLVDIQVATLDDLDALAPQCHIQVADRIGWMAQAHRLPEFERFPGQ
jgi:hypothetical protein